MLSVNVANWEAEVSASPEILLKQESISVLRHALTKATSRKPQQALWTIVKERLATLTFDSQGSTVLELLASYATPRTVGELCEALAGLDVAKMLRDANGHVVLHAVAARVDEGKGLRNKLFEAVMKPLTAKLVAESPPARRVASALICDATFAQPLAKVVTSAPVKKWFGGEIVSKKIDAAAVRFVDDLLTNAEKAGDLEAWRAVTDFVVGSVSQTLKPAAEHRPRPAVFVSLAAHGSPESLSAVATAVAKWNNLAQVVKGVHAKAFEALILRAPVDDARTLSKSVLKAVPVAELAGSPSSAVARVAVAMRERDVASSEDGAAAAILDTAQDAMNRATGNCAMASRAAVSRELARRQQAPGAGGPALTRRPRVEVVESDDDAEDVAATKAAPMKASRSSGRATATPRRSAK